MPAPRFLLKTDAARFEPVLLAGRPVHEQFEQLRDILTRRAPAAAALFAEPVTGSGAVSWYGEGTGDPQPLSALSAPRRAEVEALLSRQLAALDPLLDDPGTGPLLRRALVLADADNIVALDNAVVLTGWGSVPRGDASDEALAAQLRGVLGRFSPTLGSADAGFMAGTRRAVPEAPRPAVTPVASAPALRTAAATAPATVAGGAVVASPARAAWLIPALAGTALLFLVLGFFLAWTQFSRGVADQHLSASVVDEERTRLAIRLQRETNEQLERDVERARQAAAAPDVCTAEAPLGVVPSPERQPVRPEAVPPAVPTQPGGQAQNFTGSLAQLLERAAVMVVGAGPRGVGHGTGFFVSGNTVVTNAHVVENADPEQIFVMSVAIGRAIPAQLVTRTRGPDGGGSQPGSLDLAVLRLAEPVPGAQPLALTRTVEKLSDVVAAGYPASVVQVEGGMQTLREGRLGTPPELVLSRGSISTIQPLPNGLIVMPHSADISPGNSGGPLVDTCGRVVGVNTFVSRATEVADRVKYAQKVDSLLPWLAQAGVQVQEREGVCEPVGAALPARPPGAAAPASPGGAAQPGTAPSGTASPGPTPPPPASSGSTSSGTAQPGAAPPVPAAPAGPAR